MKNDGRVIVLGGGLAGLSCAYELCQAGRKVILLEKNESVGGLARTFEQNGFRYDSGPHRWYSKNVAVNCWLKELLTDELIQVPRLTRIYFDKKFFYYPMRFTNFWRLGWWQSCSAFVDLLRTSLPWKAPTTPMTMEEAYIRQFGRRLYEFFFKSYSEKLWGVPSTTLSGDWVIQRSRNMTILDVLKDALLKSRGKIVSLTDSFLYPQRGIGTIAETLAKRIQSTGGEVLCGVDVLKILRSGDSVVAVEAERERQPLMFEGTHFVSSIPITDLVSRLSPEPPSGVLREAGRLRFRDQVQVTLFVDKAKIFPDNWIYIQSPKLSFVRIMEMDNWSSELAPSGRTALVFEIPCQEGDHTWTMKDEPLIKRVAEEFITEFGNIRKKDILGGTVHRVAKEYPIYTLGYLEPLQILKGYLKGFGNLQLIGRNGTFRYNNMDHSIQMGLYAAWNLLGASHDIDSVNIEREFLEHHRIAR